jgi:hypothetical protein
VKKPANFFICFSLYKCRQWVVPVIPGGSTVSRWSAIKPGKYESR